MLVNMKKILNDALIGGYAIPAFDTDINILLKATLDAAQEMNSPVILQFHEEDIKGKDIHFVVSLVKGIAPYYEIPIVLHLDHGNHIDEIKRAIDHGFTSVMYDGSHLSIEENIRNTKIIVEYAHSRDVTVEAELGHVGGSDLDFNDTGESKLTDPNDVKRFIEETHVDALAVSIGTSHGVYQSEPSLNMDVLKKISTLNSIPLVIHGGSGNPTNQLRKAITHGITKINIFADLRIAFREGLTKANSMISRADPLPNELFNPISDELKKAIKEKIKICGSSKKAI